MTAGPDAGGGAGWTRPALFLVDEVPPVEAEHTLGGAEGRHAATVRRVRVGEVVLLGDGRGARARAEVTAVDRAAPTVRVLARRDDPRPDLRVTVAQALVKGDRAELAVELATEAGADALVPWRAQRCVARWDDGPRGARALERWRSAVTGAAKQARRPWVPEVTEPVDTAGLAARVAAADAALVLEATAEASLAGVALPPVGEVLLVVGPEGGIAPAELTALAAAGAAPVRLGPAVLRTSSAAAVALGALGVRPGRW